MAKLGWATAALYSRYSPSMATNHVGASRIRQKPLTRPVRIDVYGVRWSAVLTQAQCERRVTDELNAAGYRAYCPLGRKFVHFEAGKRSRQKVIREFPVFSRYIFAGAAPGQVIGRSLCDKIQGVLGDSQGPLAIPPGAIANINALELGGEWDDTQSWEEKTPFHKGVRVFITEGPFAGFPATVDAQASESRLKVLVTLFGRPTSTEIDPCHAEVA